VENTATEAYDGPEGAMISDGTVRLLGTGGERGADVVAAASSIVDH
jgi:hypothetical protein